MHTRKNIDFKIFFAFLFLLLPCALHSIDHLEKKVDSLCLNNLTTKDWLEFADKTIHHANQLLNPQDLDSVFPSQPYSEICNWLNEVINLKDQPLDKAGAIKVLMVQDAAIDLLNQVNNKRLAQSTEEVEFASNTVKTALLLAKQAKKEKAILSDQQLAEINNTTKKSFRNMRYDTQSIQ